MLMEMDWRESPYPNSFHGDPEASVSNPHQQGNCPLLMEITRAILIEYSCISVGRDDAVSDSQFYLNIWKH